MFSITQSGVFTSRESTLPGEFITGELTFPSVFLIRGVMTLLSMHHQGVLASIPPFTFSSISPFILLSIPPSIPPFIPLSIPPSIRPSIPHSDRLTDNVGGSDHDQTIALTERLTNPTENFYLQISLQPDITEISVFCVVQIKK